LRHPKGVELIDDNCCQCNFAALLHLSGLKQADLVYVTYHVDVSSIPEVSLLNGVRHAFLGYAQSQKIINSNNLKIFGSKKTNKPKQKST
jgi:hypothetical protein